MAHVDAVKYRNKVIEELLMTEKTYINGLRKLITIFIDPLETSDVISNKEFHIIFPRDIKIIYNLHETLLTEFEKEFRNLGENNQCNIGKIFIEHAVMLKMYQNYLNNHHKATQKLCALQQKKKFAKWCTKQQSKMNNQTLSSLLILPIQRIPRYELLLKELIKRTQKLNRKHKNDLNDLKAALKQISCINGTINHRMKEHEQREKVKQIKNRFDATSLKIEIIIPSRYFIMDNDGTQTEHALITKHDKFGHKTNIYMVLFNDGLVYGHSKTSIMKNCKYIFDNFLPFNRVFAMDDIGQIYKELHCIKILSSNASIWISFKCKKYKIEWLNKTNNALKAKLNKNKNIRINKGECELIQSVCLMPDDFSDICMQCEDMFSITNRRHHCYNTKCGKLVCGKCSDFKISDPKSMVISEQIRVCTSCYVTYNEKRKTRFSWMEAVLKNNIHILILLVICAVIFKEQIWNALFSRIF